MSARRRSHLRRALALGAIVAMAAPAIVLSKRVAVSVDGAVHQLRTYAGTVGDLIEAEGIELAAGDRVVPAAHSDLADGATIRILRTISVDLAIDDEPVRRVRGTFRDVGGALAAAGITETDALQVTPGLRVQLDGGETVTVRSPRTVAVTVDGATRRVATHVTRLDLLLTDLGIALGEADRIEPGVGSLIADGLEVRIQRVHYRDVVEEVTLEHATERRTTDELFEGSSRTVQQGRDGLRRDTYRVTYVDGVETVRSLIAEEVVREPLPTIVEAGTRKRPRVSVDTTSVWYRLAQCESGGRWGYDGRFDGGLQFHPDTWTRHKLSGYPTYAWQASAAQQIEVGKRVQRAQGWRAWPTCARKLGLY